MQVRNETGDYADRLVFKDALLGLNSVFFIFTTSISCNQKANNNLNDFYFFSICPEGLT